MQVSYETALGAVFVGATQSFIAALHRASSASINSSAGIEVLAGCYRASSLCLKLQHALEAAR